MHFIIFSDKKDNKYTKKLKKIPYASREQMKKYYLQWCNKKRQRALKTNDLKAIDMLGEGNFCCYAGHPRDCVINGLDIVFTSLVK